MDNSVVVPVVLFLCITLGIVYVVKLLVNTRQRIKMLQVCSSTELVESLLQADTRRYQMSALHWGVLALMEAIAFGIIQAIGWTTINPGVVAVLLGAFGLGSVVSFVLGRRLG